MSRFKVGQLVEARTEGVAAIPTALDEPMLRRCLKCHSATFRGARRQLQKSIGL
jgi:hypothetical protein